MDPKLNETIASAAAAVTGPGTPEALNVVQRDDRLRVWVRNLAGPAISILLVADVGILTWGIKLGLWTSATEEVRAQGVAAVAIALAMMLGVALWAVVAGRPSRVEIKAGPAEMTIENGEAQS